MSEHGLKLDGPPARNEVRLLLPAGSACGANRCGLIARTLKGGEVVYAAAWYAVDERETEAEVVQNEDAASVAELARLVAADLGASAVEPVPT